METTEVTPRELRDTEITERLRGYDRDEVDELLERAALTVESYGEHIRDLSDRLDALSKGQQITPVQAKTVQPEPNYEVSQNSQVQIATPTISDDLIQRTLILAQKTADETIRQAEAEANRVMSHAKKKTEEITTREKEKLITELNDLDSQRNALVAEIEELKQFDQYHRAKIKALIQEDLDNIEGRKPADSFELVEAGLIPQESDFTSSDATSPYAEQLSDSVMQEAPIANEPTATPTTEQLFSAPESPFQQATEQTQVQHQVTEQEPVIQPPMIQSPVVQAPEIPVEPATEVSQVPEVEPFVEKETISQQIARVISGDYPDEEETTPQTVASQPAPVQEPTPEPAPMEQAPQAMEQPDSVDAKAEQSSQVPGDVWEEMPAADDDFFASLRDAVSDRPSDK
jgi:DivIVA domain-containing protein